MDDKKAFREGMIASGSQAMKKRLEWIRERNVRLTATLNRLNSNLFPMEE